MYKNNLIFGKNKTEKIVSIEVIDDTVHCLTADDTEVTLPHYYWVLTNKAYSKSFIELKGNQHYKYMARFRTKKELQITIAKLTKIKGDYWTIWNPVESAMVYHGLTLFKGLKISDVSVLAFDIEAMGLAKDDESESFVITNTFRDRQENIARKQFREDDYETQQEFIEDWCEWVYDVDPDILTGHNINGYDLPYLQHCYGKKGLPLGRDGSGITFKKKPSEKRVDGAQTWTYNKIKCFGRHIVDGPFLAVMYDIGRKYPSWGLKAIAEFEGWVTDDRQFYDASKIGRDWYSKDKEGNYDKRDTICQYCADDSDDSIRVYDLMAPSLFYMCQSIPKPFQLITESASGSWLNSIMVRSYFQDGYSIPKTSQAEYVAGGMSWGNPGLYENVSKWDAASYYPNTILKFNITDEVKDPNNHYIEMVRHFTEERFANKRKYKETDDKYYNDLQESQKVFINSAYGLLGTPGLNFNNFENAATITKCCRKGLQKAVLWATGKDILEWWPEYVDQKARTQDLKRYLLTDSKSEVPVLKMDKHDWTLVNLDTDSLSFCKVDQSPWTSDEFQMIHDEINKIMYSEWEDDGRFDKVLVLKAKNYCLVPEGSDKIKKVGSSITDSKKEPALTEMLDNLINDIIWGKSECLDNIYIDYIKEAKAIQDMKRWSNKKNISKAVLKPERKNEQKVLDALKGKSYKEGDKILMFSDIDGEVQKMAKGELVFLTNGDKKMVPNKILRCTEDYTGTYDRGHYVERVYKTIKIMENVLDMDNVIKYHLKGNKKQLEEL